MSVQRYDVAVTYIGSGDYVGSMIPDKDGDYVAYTDHRAELERVAVELIVNMVRIHCESKGVMWGQDFEHATRERIDDIVRRVCGE